MSNLVILKCWLFEYMANLKKRPLLFRSEIFDVFFKTMYEESFEDLQINSNCEFQNRLTMFHKMAVLSSFCENTQKSSFDS